MASKDLVNTYNKDLQQLCNQVAPIKTKDILLRPRQIWVTEKVLELKRKARKAECRYRKWKT